METTLPTAFTDSLRTLLGDGEACALCDALQGEPSASIRMNRLKTALVPQGEPVPWCPEGTYLSHRPTFTFDPMLHAGGYYVQEASSMFVAHALRSHMPRHPLMVLDLCAAPGGKSTLLRSILPEGSLLVANEVVRSRVQVLAENLAKWGHPGVVVTNNDPADFAPLAGMFDVILADVPCSGEGMFRRDPASVGEWSPAAVDACVERQRRIVDAIWPCLKPGGLFIYSTCTYNPHEDEEQVRRMRDELGAEVLPVAGVPAEWGITGNLLPGEDFPVYRFLPHRTRGEGFFLALMRKKPDAEDVSNHDAAAFEETRNRGQKDRQKGRDARTAQPAVAQLAALRGWLSVPDDYELLTDAAGGVFAFPRRHLEPFKRLRSVLRVVQAGVPLAEPKGRDWQPCHALALSTALRREAFPCVEVDYEKAIAYLRKEAVALDGDVPRGFVLLTYHSLPLGFVKNVGNHANNLYPPEWRIRSGYLPDEVRVLPLLGE